MWLALLGALVWASPCAAASGKRGEQPLVVIASDEPDSAFVRRLAAELSLFGYRVELTPGSPGAPSLAELLASTGGSAVIAVQQDHWRVDVVMAGVGAQESEDLDPRRRPETNAAVLAERFRARLTELGIAPGAAAPLSEPRVIPEPVPPPPPLPSEQRLWVAGGVGASSGGFGFQPEASLELRAFPAPWLSTGAFAKISLLPVELREPEGEADVRLFVGGISLDLYPVRGELTVRAGLGAALVNASMTGAAVEPRDGREVSVLVPAGVANLGGAVRLSARVAVELNGFVGVCSPRIGVKFAGRTVAGYGRPMMGASLGLALGVF